MGSETKHDHGALVRAVRAGNAGQYIDTALGDESLAAALLNAYEMVVWEQSQEIKQLRKHGDDLYEFVLDQVDARVAKRAGFAPDRWKKLRTPGRNGA